MCVCVKRVSICATCMYVDCAHPLGFECDHVVLTSVVTPLLNKAHDDVFIKSVLIYGSEKMFSFQLPCSSSSGRGCRSGRC